MNTLPNELVMKIAEYGNTTLIMFTITNILADDVDRTTFVTNYYRPSNTSIAFNILDGMTGDDIYQNDVYESILNLYSPEYIIKDILNICDSNILSLLTRSYGLQQYKSILTRNIYFDGLMIKNRDNLKKYVISGHANITNYGMLFDEPLGLDNFYMTDNYHDDVTNVDVSISSSDSDSESESSINPSL